MEFEWDETKRLANLKKHGLDFTEVLQFAWETAQTVLDDRVAYGEEREIAFGMYRGSVHVVIYTQRRTCSRIISFRRATRQEARIYHEEEKNRS